MFGWEFPPFNSGGLGVACEGLSKALSSGGVDLTFVLPFKIPISASWCKFIFADESADLMNEKQIRGLFAGYQSHIINSSETQKYGLPKFISGDLMQRVKAYSLAAKKYLPKKTNILSFMLMIGSLIRLASLPKKLPANRWLFTFTPLSLIAVVVIM